MSTVIRPVGPLPPRVYWVRRILLIAAVVVVVALVAAAVSKIAGAGDASPAKPTPSAAATEPSGSGGKDGQPAGGSRPSDGWSVGEIVEDRHAVAIPPEALPGPYLLRIALYDPADGRRLMAGGRDHVDLPLTVISEAPGRTDPSRLRR